MQKESRRQEALTLPRRRQHKTASRRRSSAHCKQNIKWERSSTLDGPTNLERRSGTTIAPVVHGRRRQAKNPTPKEKRKQKRMPLEKAAKNFHFQRERQVQDAKTINHSKPCTDIILEREKHNTTCLVSVVHEALLVGSSAREEIGIPFPVDPLHL